MGASLLSSLPQPRVISPHPPIILPCPELWMSSRSSFGPLPCNRVATVPEMQMFLPPLSDILEAINQLEPHSLSLGALRHAKTLQNKERLNSGTTDVSILETERPVIQHTAQTLFETGTPDIVFTSPLLRARQTVEIILESLGYKIPVCIDWRLSERQKG